jgi:Na+/proline symporter
VIFYTAVGGLRACFMASYIHTAILMLALLTFKVYASSAEVIGSPGKARSFSRC